MYNEYKVALDIWTYLYRLYYGTSKEEIDFRVHWGSNGVVNKVLDYIKNKYMEEEEYKDA